MQDSYALFSFLGKKERTGQRTGMRQHAEFLGSVLGT